MNTTSYPSSFGYEDPRSLNIDREHYQRPYRLKKEMPEYVDLDYLVSIVPVLVSERADRTRWVIDGQHRVIHAMERGILMIPAIILKGLTLQQEALIFAGINEGRRNLTPAEIVRAKVTGEEPITQALVHILDDEGIRIVGRLTDTMGDAATSQVGMLMWIQRRLGLDMVRRALRFLRATWPGTPQLLSGTNLQAAAIVLHRLDSSFGRAMDAQATQAVLHEGLSLDVLRQDYARRSKEQHGTTNGRLGGGYFANVLEERLRAILPAPSSTPPHQEEQPSVSASPPPILPEHWFGPNGYEDSSYQDAASLS